MSAIRTVTLNARGDKVAWPRKAPAEVLDYALDWTPRLPAGDRIASSVFTLPPGVSASVSSFGADRTEVWISGGVDGGLYRIVNRIKTSGGRTMDQTVRLRVRAK